jgi:hypothetical protein
MSRAGKLFQRYFKDIFYCNALTKVAGLAVKQPLKEFKKSMNYKE